MTKDTVVMGKYQTQHITTPKTRAPKVNSIDNVFGNLTIFFSVWTHIKTTLIDQLIETNP